MKTIAKILFLLSCIPKKEFENTIGIAIERRFCDEIQSK